MAGGELASSRRGRSAERQEQTTLPSFPSSTSGAPRTNRSSASNDTSYLPFQHLMERRVQARIIRGSGLARPRTDRPPTLGLGAKFVETGWSTLDFALCCCCCRFDCETIHPATPTPQHISQGIIYSLSCREPLFLWKIRPSYAPSRCRLNASPSAAGSRKFFALIPCWTSFAPLYHTTDAFGLCW